VRRLFLIAVLALGLAACGGSSRTGSPLRVEFGTSGGNIRPQKFVVTVSGDLANRLRDQAGGLLTCEGTLPDVAAAYVRMDGRTFTVHGSCDPSFSHLWRKLYALRGASG
jgi:hypothetical protein